MKAETQNVNITAPDETKSTDLLYLQYIHMRLHAALHSLFKIVAFLLKLNYTQGNCQLSHQDKMFALKEHYVVLEEKFKIRIVLFRIVMVP